MKLLYILWKDIQTTQICGKNCHTIIEIISFRDKIMNLTAKKTYLRVNERRIRSENLIFVSDFHDFYVTN